MNKNNQLTFKRTAGHLLCLASVGLLSSGCGPGGPSVIPAPASEDIFQPADGTVFSSPYTASVILNGLDGGQVTDNVVCATTDASVPALDGAGGCSVGSLVVGSEIALGCVVPNVSSPTPVLESYTVNIAFEWNDGENAPTSENHSASYDVDCTEYYAFQIVGLGNITGATTGTNTINGFARFNPHSGAGNFEYSYTNESVTAYTNITAEKKGGFGGLWSAPVLSNLQGQDANVACINNGGLVNGCDSADIGIFDAIQFISGDPMTIPAAPGGVINYSTTAEGGGGAVTTVTDYTFTRVL